MTYKDRLAVAEGIMLSLQASKRDRRKTGGKRPEDDWPEFPPLIVREGDAIRKSSHKAARVYFMFFFLYTPAHIWTFQELGWRWNDPKARFDPKFPDNRQLGHALELVQAVDQQGLEWVKRGTIAYREQVSRSVGLAIIQCGD